jgi:hypothetical protein
MMIWILVIGTVVIFFGFAVFFGAPYVPSKKKYIRRAFEQLYPLGPRDVLVDIGSGDGVVLRTASEKGARAVGYEINPLLVLISRVLSAGDGRVSVRLANFWHAELPTKTTVAYIFSVSRDGNKLMRKMQAEADRLKKPLSLMCYGSPLKGVSAEKAFEAYHLYKFHPLQGRQAQV